MNFQLHWRTFQAIASTVVAEIPKVIAEIPKFVMEQKKTVITVAACLGIVAAPIIVAGPLLSVLGFTSGGIAAGSIAAMIQSTIGSVAAGSLFAVLQSAAMGGAGMLIVAATVQTIVGLVAVLGSVNLLMKSLNGNIRLERIQAIPRKPITVEEAEQSAKPQSAELSDGPRSLEHTRSTELHDMLENCSSSSPLLSNMPSNVSMTKGA